MKQLLWIVVAVAVVGCGPKETTVVTGPNGEKMTASKDGSSTTYSDNKGNKLTIDANAKTMSGQDEKGNSYSMGSSVNEGELGLPFYPGSAETANGAMKVDTKDELDVISTRTTQDDPDKVIAFYKDKIEEAKPASTSTPEMKMGTLNGKLKSGAEVTISAMRSGTEATQISVAVKTKKAK